MFCLNDRRHTLVNSVTSFANVDIDFTNLKFPEMGEDLSIVTPLQNLA